LDVLTARLGPFPDPAEAPAGASADPAGAEARADADYAIAIVRGVAQHAEEIDEWLTTYSQGWPLERMPAVDRAIARLGAWEVVFAEGVPDEVALEQAADLAGSLSTDRSPDFISGLLGRISRLKPTLR
jgi:N utilization substance protein B